MEIAALSGKLGKPHDSGPKYTLGIPNKPRDMLCYFNQRGPGV